MNMTRRTDKEFYTVPELAKDLEVTPRAIRLYESKGLLNPQRAGNTRIYSRKERARLIMILRGKRLGFKLSEIGEFLDLYEIDTNQVSQLKMLLDKVRVRIEDLEEQETELKRVLDELREIEKQSLQALTERGVEPT